MKITCDVCFTVYFTEIYPDACPLCGKPPTMWPRELSVPVMKGQPLVRYGAYDPAERLNRMLGLLFGTAINLVQYPFRRTAAAATNALIANHDPILKMLASLKLRGEYQPSFEWGGQWTPSFDGTNVLTFNANQQIATAKRSLNVTVTDVPIGNVFVSQRRKESFTMKGSSDMGDQALLGRMDVELMGRDIEFGQQGSIVRPGVLSGRVGVSSEIFPGCVLTFSVLHAYLLGSFMRSAPWTTPFDIRKALTCRHQAAINATVDSNHMNIGLRMGSWRLNVPFGMKTEFDAIIVDEPVLDDPTSRTRARLDGKFTLKHVYGVPMPTWGLFTYKKSIVVTQDRTGKFSAKPLPSAPSTSSTLSDSEVRMLLMSD